MNKASIISKGIFITVCLSLAVFLYTLFINPPITNNNKITKIENTLTPSITISPTNVPTNTPSPTPKPLTFAEMNERYGPCIKVPVLTYHHIQSQELATKNKQTSLSVYTSVFERQLQYLKELQYNTITPAQLIKFFDVKESLPSKSILLSFDDGYEDFYTDAYPLLKKFGFRGIVFLPTGLMNNPGYLTWDQIKEMSAYGILFGNHTWSHQTMQTNPEKILSEIATADTQLIDRQLNNPKIFAYPYGTISKQSESVLKQYGYNIAFSTKSGSTLCRKLRLELPRLRIGSTNLSSYGL
jgi:peptidoglycan/xylan/chitin deacetylase (PgdA/CDA1 family)